ncbi:MAG: methyl-accepting chemotaxis protein [Haloplanus sp.]
MRLLPSFVRDSYLKQFATIVAVVLVVVAGAGMFFHGEVTEELRHERQNELRTMAELEADAISEWLNRNSEKARLLSEFGSIQSGDRERIDATLQHELEQFESTRAIHYVDLDTRRIVESTADDRVGTTVPEVTWARGSFAVKDASTVAVTEGYRQGGTEVIAFLSRIEGTDRAIMLTANARQRANKFRTPTETSFTQVVDSHGRVEFAQNEEAALEPYQHGKGHVRKAQNGETGVMDMPDRGLVVGYAPVEGADWVVVTHTPRSEAYALAGIVTRDFLALIGISLAGFIVIGVTLGRDTVTALDRLTNDAEAIAQGNVDIAVETSDREDEIGRLTDAFVDMQAYLSTVASQAEAVADQRFDAAVLDQDVPGTFGETIGRMSEDVERAQRNVEQARREVEDLNADLETTADAFGETMSKAADGDLTQRMNPESRSEAMVTIAESFNEMMDEMEATLGRIRSFADEVAAASQQVTASTEEVRSASAEVSESIQEVSAGAERQDDRLTEISGEMQSLSGAIEEVASSADEVAATADNAAEISEAGSDAAADAIDELERIEAQTDATVEEVVSLADEIDEIGDIVDLIADIAEQTNMLALNASIEAARADTDGDGFAVVADEIKSLAGEATDATERIDRRIADIQESADCAVDNIQEMGDGVTHGAETIDEALASLDDVAQRVETLHTGVQEISEATDDQAASTTDVVSMLDEVERVADRSSAEAANVSAAAEEQTSTLADVSESAQSLTEQADSLQDLLDQFVVDDRGTPAEATGTTRGSAAPDGGVDP